MLILNISIIVFVLMESANVIILYFFPDSRLGNGVAAFNAWEESKANEEAHLYVRYMTNWVAGVKLIFIALLLVILFTGSELTKICAVVAMIFSIASYFFRLRPIMSELDKRNKITPNGYSRTLDFMILGFILMFSTALAMHFIV